MLSNQKATTISTICGLVTVEKLAEAREVLSSEYPFVPMVRVSRTYTPRQMTRVFVKACFTDEYRGQKLIFPPVLRMLSNLFPELFPYHKNGKMDEGHIAYWELFPTVDHLVPIARGGKDDESNWICCSMLSNSIKANWTLEELGWQVQDPDDRNWDGMLNWFLNEYERRSDFRNDKYIRRWHAAALDVMKGS